MDINQSLLRYRAEVYQYVGDEIVLTWRAEDGLMNQNCVGFYFACKKIFQERFLHYQQEYGLVPHFKAGIHIGKVTVVEVGDIKRDIAYHGDTLNTAARIQSVCNDFNKSLLMSEVLLKRIDPGRLVTEYLGSIHLKGKLLQVPIVSVEQML